MSKRAVIYARVSTDMQRGNFSIPSQVESCLKYAEKYGYLVVGDSYVDSETGLDTIPGNGAVPAYVDDFTSRELSRPSLDAAFVYLETIGFDILMVHALDRLARDPYIRQTLEREFIARGATIEYVLGNYEDTPEGEVKKDLEATFAKWENAKRVERSLRGKRRKAESGKFVAGRAPYGYCLDKESSCGLVIDDVEAEVVRRVFYLYLEENCSIRQIAHMLTIDKVPPQLGGKKWGKTSVRKLLSNTAYIGHCYYNKFQRKEDKLIKRSKDEWIRIDVPPLIEQFVFEQVQKKLDENRRIKRNQPKRFYLLSGMIFCADCGRPFLSQTAKAGNHRRKNDSPSYRHRVKEGHCINRFISARRLEPIVWSEISKILLDPQRLRKGYEESLGQQEAASSRQKTLLKTLQERLIKQKQIRQNLTALYIDPDVKMTKYEYLEQKEVVDDAINDALREIEIIETELAKVPKPADFSSLETFASKIRGRLIGDIDPKPEDKRRLLELLHVKVMIGVDGSIRLDGWFGESSDCLLSPTSACCVRQPRPPPGPV